MTHYELFMFWTGQVAWMIICFALGTILTSIIYYLIKAFFKACSWLRFTLAWIKEENMKISKKELICLIRAFFKHIVIFSDGREWTVSAVNGKYKWNGYGRWRVERKKRDESW